MAAKLWLQYFYRDHTLTNCSMEPSVDTFHTQGLSIEIDSWKF